MNRIRRHLSIPLLAAMAVIIPTMFVAGGDADAGNPRDCGDRFGFERHMRKTCVVRVGLPGEPWDPAGNLGGGATRDRIEPDLLKVRSGTTIEFKNEGAPHRISIYNHGLGSNGVTNFADVTGAVVANVRQANATPGETLVGPTEPGASTTYTFTEPGQYLVICSFNPHFVNLGQAAFIIVEESAN